MSRFARRALPAKVDSESGYLVAMTPEHATRHKGGAFSFSYNPNPIGANGYVAIMIKTSADTNIEVAYQKARIASDTPIRTWFLESPTFTTQGTALTLIQRNRNSTTLPATQIYATTISFTSEGTLLRTLIYDQGRNPIEEDEGWSLKSNTWYALKVFNLGTTITDYFNLSALFYETRR